MKSPFTISVLLILSSFLICSCASQRDIKQDRVLSNGVTQTPNAIRSDYLVRSGATMNVGFSNESRYFVENGGRLEGFSKGIRKTQIFAEKGSILSDNLQKDKSSKQLRLVETKDASKAFSERNKPWNQPATSQRSGRLAAYPATYYGWGWYGNPYYRNYYGGRYSYYPRHYGHNHSSSRSRPVSARVVSGSVRRKN